MTETSGETTFAAVESAPDLRPGRAAAALNAVLRAPVRARTWKELLYIVAALPLGVLAWAYVFVGFGGGLFFSFTVLGIPVLVLVLLGGRVWGRIYRALCAGLLDTPVQAPPEFAPRPGLIGWLTGAFTDRTAWRATLFLLAQCVLGVFAGYYVLTTVAVVLLLAIAPVPWALFHPVNVDDEGVEHHSMIQIGDHYFDTWPEMLAVAACGIALCFALPWLVRALCWTHRKLTVALLGATARDRTLTDLRASRRAAVDDAAATLRRVERDLHDGTQARLVTIAMALGRAEERLSTGGDARDLIADAYADSKEALTELRELVRGIHPPALELGLAPALETLTARCALPVELRVLLPRRPAPAIEAIAYFSVAELLTNVVKHARAEHISVTVTQSDTHTLAITVRDNGIGGVAQPVEGAYAAGSGLAGLAARAKAVDGSLTVDSPVGGPTVVTMRLPKDGPR